MLQADEPDDYVIATGETHSVREFCELAFSQAGLQLTWRGNGVEEQGIDTNGRILVEIDSRYFRPTEADLLQGDSAKAQEKLGWIPLVRFPSLVLAMVNADESLAKNEKRNIDAITSDILASSTIQTAKA